MSTSTADSPDLDRLREQATASLRRLAQRPDADELAQAKHQVEALRNVRELDLMGRLAEAVSRVDPKDARNRRLYAQYLIDSGRATAAIDLLKPLAARLAKDHPEHAEATGLLGRAYKQIFFDAGDTSSAGAREALKQAIAAYRRPYEENRRANAWQGVNLLALLSRARSVGLRVAPDLQPAELAAELVATLEAVPVAERDKWYLSTLTEARLGLGLDAGHMDELERQLHAYVSAPGTAAFQIASTLRQFTQVWGLDDARPAARGFDPAANRARNLPQILRARLLQLPGGGLEMSSGQLQSLRSAPPPEAGQLEAVLGTQGPQTFAWWRAGLESARSVAVIRQKLGRRLGTGFLVRAADFGLTPGEELLVLTNFHVVNANGASPGIKPAVAEVVFEAADPGRVYTVSELLWSSPPDQHDASLLRLATPVADIAPLAIASELPPRPVAVADAAAAGASADAPQVYVVGYPGGRELSFSFQDNELLDHEGPDGGQPQIPGVCRVHYRAPTEGGSSGSPVFNATAWEVIALHHKGGKFGMPRLNGQPGTYAANEGLAINTLIAAMHAR